MPCPNLKERRPVLDLFTAEERKVEMTLVVSDTHIKVRQLKVVRLSILSTQT